MRRPLDKQLGDIFCLQILGGNGDRHMPFNCFQTEWMLFNSHNNPKDMKGIAFLILQRYRGQLAYPATIWQSQSLDLILYGFEICIYQCMQAQLCLTLCDPMDYSPPGFSVHEICQARLLELVANSFFRGSSPPRDRTHVSCVSCRAGGFLTT